MRTTVLAGPDNRAIEVAAEPRDFGDLFNAFNRDTALVRNNNVLSPTFNTLAQNLSPRIFRVGLVVGF
ncbi:MAG: hypothetical protein HY048_12055 [Acidobacteria bacterium]|nr:hypothetical protein [Acidobacteriota bacterium]